MTLRDGAAIGGIFGGLLAALWGFIHFLPDLLLFLIQHSPELLTIFLTTDRFVAPELPGFPAEIFEVAIPIIGVVVVGLTLYSVSKSAVRRFT